MYPESKWLKILVLKTLYTIKTIPPGVFLEYDDNSYPRLNPKTPTTVTHLYAGLEIKGKA